jgi:hypothetical protein
MLADRESHQRSDRYRLEARYLRGLSETFAAGKEQESLRRIADAYERLAEQILGAPVKLPGPVK